LNNHGQEDKDAFDVNTYYKNFKVLLLQTGYLTLGDYDEPSANFTVAYPNWEVRRAMTGQSPTKLASVF